MRVVHVIGTLDPAAGGPPMVASRLAGAQAGLGRDVHVLCYADPGRQKDVDEAMAGLPHFEKVKVHPVTANGHVERVAARQAAGAMAELLSDSQPTILHLHGVWEAILRAAAKVARKAGKPYAVAPHGMLDPWSLQQKAMKKRIALTLGYRRMLDEAAFLHTLNQDEQSLIAPLNLKSRCEVIPNGVFLEEIDPLPQAGSFRSARPELGDSPYVLFLSRLHYKKGLDRLAAGFTELAKRCDKIHLVVAGPDGGEQSMLEQRVRDAGLDGRVHLTGPLWGKDKLAAMVDSACFCLPSRQEGFSVAITEAMACGRPVVITDACHFPEVAEVQAGCVVTLNDDDSAGSANTLAEALHSVLTDSDQAASMGAAGRELIETRFTWPKIAELSINCYERAMNG